MTLANMVILDEDALVCDLAETYGIFDMWSLPAQLVATLAIGLRDNSRIKTKILKMDMPLEDYLLAAIFDCVNWLCWTHTKGAERGNNMPQRVVEILTQKESIQDQDDLATFASGDDFERARAALLGE